MPETPEFPEEFPLVELTAVSGEPTAPATEYEMPTNAHVSEPTKEKVRMLDIHDAHHAANGWKEFFVHIATIVLGLLIAVGLEQTVEYIHHRREVQEIRKALVQERQKNRVFYNLNTAGFRYEAEELENNLHVFVFLQQRPGTPEEKLPGVPQWGFAHAPIVASTWKNAQQTQVLGYMPWEETEADAQLYDFLGLVDKDALSALDAQGRAGSYASVDPNPSHMTPAQVSAEIDLIQDAIRTNINWAVHLKNLHEQFPDFSPAPTEGELTRIAGWVRSAEDKKKLRAAQTATDTALAPSAAALVAAIKAADTH
jgi:hypothetical protein